MQNVSLLNAYPKDTTDINPIRQSAVAWLYIRLKCKAVEIPVRSASKKKSLAWRKDNGADKVVVDEVRLLKISDQCCCKRWISCDEFWFVLQLFRILQQ